MKNNRELLNDAMKRRNKNGIIQGDIPDVELAIENDVEIKKNTPNTKMRVRPEDSPQKNMNHLRDKQMY